MAERGGGQRVASGVWAWLAIGMVCLFEWGCALPPPPVGSLPPPAAPGGLFVSAVPAYRLSVEPVLADAPSRLVVLYARIENQGDSRLRFSPNNVDIQLPNGDSARVLDYPRAVAVLERTDIGVWSTDYARDNSRRYPPGGLRVDTKRRVKNEVRDALLREADVSSYRPLEGYLVVDTGRAFSTLDGSTMDVVASRVGDSTPVRNSYEFAANRGVQAGR